MIEAITFDFWNTLFKLPDDDVVDTRRAQDVCEVLLQGGYETTIPDIMNAFNNCWRKAHFMQRASGRDLYPDKHVDFILEQLNLNVSKEIWEAVFTAYTTTLLKYPPELNDDVLETLPELAHSYKLAVICNTGVTPGVILRKFMKDNKIYSYFDSLIFSDEVAWAKPDVNIFNFALMNLKVDNHLAAHIGDDPITDIIGAKKAGLKAVWLAPHANWAVPECDYHVRSVKELITLF